VLAMIAEQEELFWQRIIERRPPPVDGAGSTSDALKAMFPEAATGKLCELPSELIPVARELAAVRAERSRLKDVEAEHANRLRAALEDAETATVAGEPLFTFKSHLRSQFDKAALEAEHPELVARFTTRKPTRTLRFVTPKKGK
jgi:predicted phage-related endonuclease